MPLFSKLPQVQNQRDIAKVKVETMIYSFQRDMYPYNNLLLLLLTLLAEVYTDCLYGIVSQFVPDFYLKRI